MEVVMLDGFKAVGLKITCNEKQLSVEMPKLWGDFTSRKCEIKNRVDNYLMDICLEVVEKSYTQYICLKVENFDFIPDGMEAIMIPPQKYIHYRHEGDAKDIWMSFWNMQKWAQENGYRLDSKDFKIDTNLENDNLVHELYIRIL